ncbi:hypothetical protein CDL12_03959 [Handroanthus impetiginosus]|uniref:Uncharacterized protein n=1 Tax=Handroanthus impetiginosus TaxID=429701 RepID=A0A2G9I0N2_9LAMI|nr:hypothetical protein CDL12_03959 [Handroanthus impetiginosus]
MKKYFRIDKSNKFREILYETDLWLFCGDYAKEFKIYLDGENTEANECDLNNDDYENKDSFWDSVTNEVDDVVDNFMQTHHNSIEEADNKERNDGNGIDLGDELIDDSYDMESDEDSEAIEDDQIFGGKRNIDKETEWGGLCADDDGHEDEIHTSDDDDYDEEAISCKKEFKDVVRASGVTTRRSLKITSNNKRRIYTKYAKRN